MSKFNQKNISIIFLAFNISSIEILINPDTALISVALVLLDTRWWPSSDLAVVWERSTVVVVCVPKRNRGCTCASSSWPHNSLPHILAAVDSCFLSVAFDCADELVHVVAVGCVISAPSTASTWVDLNVKPDHAIARFKHFSSVLVHLLSKLRRQSADKATHLWASALSTAWEHVDIYILDSSVFGVLYISWSTWVEGTIAQPRTCDNEIFSRLIQASKIIETLRQIYSTSS